jgi:hypothetical protein
LLTAIEQGCAQSVKDLPPDIHKTER